MTGLDLGVTFCTEHVHVLLVKESVEGTDDVLADLSKEVDEAKQLIQDLQLAVDIIEAEDVSEGDIQQAMMENDEPDEIASTLLGEGYDYEYYADDGDSEEDDEFTDIDLQ